MAGLDYIIVGQGLAGSFLGYELLKLGCNILIVDEGAEVTCSKVAAGLFSPVSGQRMALAWNVHRVFSHIDPFYRRLESTLGVAFYHPGGIYKPFGKISDFNDWMGRSADPAYQPFIKEIHKEGLYNHIMNDRRGGIELNKAGYVNTVTLLREFRRFFEKKNVFAREKFSHNLVNLYTDSAEYDGYHCKKIIFCEGPSVVHNPYFNWLPFNLVKGELLTLRSDLQLNQIISKEVFLLPIGEGLFKAGATYDRNDTSWATTLRALDAILSKLSEFRANFEVVGHQAGVRPATRDRRPFVGLHPEKKPLGLFNGLGAKGVSLAPFYAAQFAGHLVFNEQLDETADLRRYI